MESLVQTRAGKVRGRLAGGLHVFLGVPYAAPPVGANRFRPPQPVEPWSGTRDVLSFGARPLQPIAPPEIAALAPDPSVNGDDCLNLNIWTKTLDASGMPVMVWIPGGKFEVGSGASYDGSRFARDDVVCVTINYRVGANGFLYLDEGEANFGLLDQVAALIWVRDNIAAFGGDPNNVTIFGESAGAMCIGALLAMPKARGLFRRAILQSGGPQTVMSAETAQKVARRFAEKLGVRCSRDTIAGTPDDRFLAAQTDIQSEVIANPDPERWGKEVVATLTPFHTVIDGGILPSAPLARIAAGVSSNVDIIVGSNVDEWRLFVVTDGLLAKMSDEILLGPVATHGYQCLVAYGVEPKNALAAYRAAHPNTSPMDVLAAVETDWWCRIPAIRLAEARVNAPGATYMYEFAWPSPAGGGLFGACHALEIAFVFDTLDKGADQMLGTLLGDAPPQALADTMHKAWVTFAATGNPGWPKYDARRRATMRFDVVSGVVDDPRRWEREFWEGAR